MKIVFAGTPDVAVPSIQKLIAAGLSPELILTRPDAPVGRKRILQPSAVGAFSAEAGMPVIKTKTIDQKLVDQVRENFQDFDLGVVVAYGGLIREPVLSAPKHGWINLHFSALPSFRGAAPVQRALLAGETQTALTIFRLVADLDAGDILATEEIDFLPTETADQALSRLAHPGADLLVKTIMKLGSGSLKATPQQGEVSLAPKFTREDGYLDFSLTASEIYNRFRAVTSEPGAYSELDGEQIKILMMQPVQLDEEKLAPGELRFLAKKLLIGTADTPLELLRVQPAGKRAMVATDWWRGR